MVDTSGDRRVTDEVVAVAEPVAGVAAVPVPVARADQLAALLPRVHGALDGAGIWHTLIFGSLLGAVRDGDIITWDHDIDLLVRADDLPTIAEAAPKLAEAGIELVRGSLAGARLALNPGQVPAFWPGYLWLVVDGACIGEVYAPTLFADGVLRLYDPANEVSFWPQSSFPTYFVESLSTATVRGVPYPVPRDAERLLHGFYGADWNVPIRSHADGGEARPGLGPSGDDLTPHLASMVDWCLGQGWDRSVYASRPAWPRMLDGAGPFATSSRTVLTSRSGWWHTLDDLTAHY
ncbi:MAG TPA: LicD family protein [Acidimicrobiales bacterium]|nr:LicD family protein [Acidimicrobiales bacterium]